ncbi:DUF7093 family protein [Halobacterium jilantaiense]|uniref:Uncharacterized protein n=1 Tax=Halobacterium jilantaiense TaxID=355548 RepID=A0A1I0PBE7_9EURY|nr:hypothetical protein [Halobacterium jilantaiense]SEW11455.1 hypothetical protein SAMN04487945_1547 [Halobacterium jilantaiense]
MGIRCSLLGHDYGESFVERDREERGNEVVVTERELRECNRCGAEHVTSENTEVRPVQPEPESTTDADASTDTASPTDTVDAGAQPTDDDPDTGDAGGAFTSATEVIEQAEAGMSGGAEASGAGVDDTTDPAADPDADDAVILDDDPDDTGPGSDQWDEPADPEVDPDDPGTPTPDPEDEDVEFVGSSGPDEPVDPDPSEPADSDTSTGVDAASATAGTATEPGDDLERDRGEWPEPEGEDQGFDATPGDDPAGEAGAATADAETGTFEFGEEPEPDPAAETGFTSAGPVDQAGTDDLDFTLFCPECGFERYAAGSSLRAGDICPECKRGYLGEDR